MAGDANDVLDLLAAYADSMAVLRRRGVTRSANSPISDFAEHLGVWHYRGVRTPPSTKSHDLVASDGRRVEVKAMWQLRGTRSSLSALRDLESAGFDLLLAVVFAPDLRSWSGYELDHSLVMEMARPSKTWKADRLTLSRRLLADTRVRRVQLRMPPDSYWAGVAQS